MIEFFVPGKPRPRGSKTAMPIYMNRPRCAKCGMPGLALKDGRIINRYVDSAAGSDKWMKEVAKEAKRHRPQIIWDDAVTIVCIFLHPRPKNQLSSAKDKQGQPKDLAPDHKITSPDVLKMGRAIEDALKGIIYTDDARVVSHTSIKSWSLKYEGVLVRLWPDADLMNLDEYIDALLAGDEIAKPF